MAASPRQLSNLAMILRGGTTNRINDPYVNERSMFGRYPAPTPPPAAVRKTIAAATPVKNPPKPTPRPNTPNTPKPLWKAPIPLSRPGGPGGGTTTGQAPPGGPGGGTQTGQAPPGPKMWDPYAPNSIQQAIDAAPYRGRPAFDPGQNIPAPVPQYPYTGSPDPFAHIRRESPDASPGTVPQYPYAGQIDPEAGGFLAHRPATGNTQPDLTAHAAATGLTGSRGIVPLASQDADPNAPNWWQHPTPYRQTMPNAESFGQGRGSRRGPLDTVVPPQEQVAMYGQPKDYSRAFPGQGGGGLMGLLSHLFGGGQ